MWLARVLGFECAHPTMGMMCGGMEEGAGWLAGRLAVAADSQTAGCRLQTVATHMSHPTLEATLRLDERRSVVRTLSCLYLYLYVHTLSDLRHGRPGTCL
jgi:hypothetical protein